MHHLDPDQLRSFVAIAEAGSFTRAADLVAKTQSAVSMQIRRLEERVGASLFERDGRTSRLTADGERLLPFARRLLKLHAEALQAFDSSLEAGLVRLGVPDDYAGFLPEILGRFACSRPLVEMTVVCKDSIDLIDLALKGDLDIAIVTHIPSRERPIPRILRREALVWVTSERHNASEEKPLPLAVASPQCPWRQAATDELAKLDRDYRIAFSSWNTAAVIAAVVAGLGVSVLPPFLVQPGMRVLTSADGFPPLPDCEIAVVRTPQSHSALIDSLYEHIVASLSRRSEAPGAPVAA
jgi:DNA-binding transcriptional LysR family regulator